VIGRDVRSIGAVKNEWAPKVGQFEAQESLGVGKIHPARARFGLKGMECPCLSLGNVENFMRPPMSNTGVFKVSARFDEKCHACRRAGERSRF